MNPSYFRIQLPLKEALRRWADFNGVADLGPLTPADSMRAIDLACTPEGAWRGPALFIHEQKTWTTFEDFSGHFSSLPASAWLKFAGQAPFILAGYNDAIPYGEFIAIENGQVLCEFLDAGDDPEAGPEASGPDKDRFKSWIDVASFVDGDDMGSSDEGLLWIGGTYTKAPL